MMFNEPRFHQEFRVSVIVNENGAMPTRLQSKPSPNGGMLAGPSLTLRSFGRHHGPSTRRYVYFNSYFTDVPERDDGKPFPWENLRVAHQSHAFLKSCNLFIALNVTETLPK